jgi:hypothetical protein
MNEYCMGSDNTNTAFNGDLGTQQGLVPTSAHTKERISSLIFRVTFLLLTPFSAIYLISALATDTASWNSVAYYKAGQHVVCGSLLFK